MAPDAGDVAELDVVPEDPIVLEEELGIVEPLAVPVDEPDIDEPDEALEPEPVGELELAPGCMAGDPDVVEPEPVAAGRSVLPEGCVVDCAKAGAVARAVATRQAAICVFSIWIS